MGRILRGDQEGTIEKTKGSLQEGREIERVPGRVSRRVKESKNKREKEDTGVEWRRERKRESNGKKNGREEGRKREGLTGVREGRWRKLKTGRLGKEETIERDHKSDKEKLE